MSRPEQQEQSDERLARDTRTAEAIVRAMVSDGEECPGDEVIASLIDGALTGDAREKALRHVASCTRCYRIYRLADRVAASTPASAAGRLRWAGAIAVAAVVVVAVYLAAGPQSTPERVATSSPPSSSLKAQSPVTASPQPQVQKRAEPPSARQLAKPAESLDSVAALLASVSGGGKLPEPNRSDLGFAGLEREGAVAFRAGVAAVRLAVSMRKGDAAARNEDYRALANEVTPVITGSERDTILNRLREGVDAGNPSLVTSTLTPEQLRLSAINAGYFTLGSWAEETWLAASFGTAEYFYLPEFRSRGQRLLEGTFPPETRELIGAILRGAEKRPINTDRLSSLQTKGRDLLLLYSTR